MIEWVTACRRPSKLNRNCHQRQARSSLPSPEAIRVVVIEDQRVIREGLSFLIAGTDGFRCVGAFASMEEALAGLPEADIGLVDIGLPGLSGIEGIPLLKKRQPLLRLVALTVYDDDERIFQALCAGASGYLLKKTAPARLLEGLRDVVAGGSAMSPEVANRVIALFKDFRPPEKADYHLTPHELRVLKLLAEGHSYKTAAAELATSVNTIGFHIRNIYDKLQVHSKSEAVAKALRDGLFR
jgi:DNA-binding NarL/FixJ family response regulator